VGHRPRFPGVASEAQRNELETFKLDGMLAGVWGLDDSFVVVWGDRGADGVMYQGPCPQSLASIRRVLSQ
jgi:hypothetical protein